MRDALLMLAPLAVVTVVVLVTLTVLRSKGIATNRPTTTAGRLPYLAIAGALVIAGGLLLAH